VNKLASGIGLAALGAVILAVLPSQAASRPAATPAPSWAVVNTNGTLARGHDATASAQDGSLGTYLVTFNKDVSGCAYVATAGVALSTDVTDDAVVFNVAPSTAGTNTVFVEEYDIILASDSYSTGFHLVVTC